MKIAIKKNTDQLEFLYSKKDFKAFGLKKKFKFYAGFKIEKKDLSNKNELTSKTLYIKGYASTDDQDRVDDIITLDALKKSQNDLLKQGSRTVFYNHDRSKAIGRVVATSMDEKGLICEVQISNADDVKDIRTKIKEKVLNAFSIGGRFKKVQVERDDKGDITSFKVLEIELFEVSVVGIPCNPKASITSVVEKSFKNFSEKPLSIKEPAMEKETKKKKVKKALEVSEVKKVKRISEKTVKALIEASINPINKGIEAITKTLEVIAANKQTKTEGKEKEVKEEKDTDSSVLKEILDRLSGVEKKFEGVTGKRKGVQKAVDADEPEELEEEVEEEEEEEVDSNPEKCLDPQNPDSITYVKWLLGDGQDDKGNPSVYEKLEKEEKRIVDGIYFSLMLKKGNRKSA